MPKKFDNYFLQTSNPYHFVRQGEINSLADASPAQRLRLLEDFAGTTVHKVKFIKNRLQYILQLSGHPSVNVYGKNYYPVVCATGFKLF